MKAKKVIYPNLVAELARNGIRTEALATSLGYKNKESIYIKLRGKRQFTLKDMVVIQEALKANDRSGDYSLDYLFARAE